MMSLFKKSILLLICFCLLNHSAVASKKAVTLDLQNVALQDALYIIANQLHLNVILSPTLSGHVSLYLHHVSLEDTLNMLLTSHDLVKIPLQNGWYIVPRKEWIQHAADELKLEEVLEASAPLVNRIWQIHYAKANDVSRLIQENGNTLLSKRGHVREDARTNIICVQDTGEHLEAIAHLISRVDVPIAQVRIATRLASVDSDFERNLGIHFEVSASLPNAAVPGRYGLLVAHLADGSILDVQLSALENEGHAELLSSPELFTANQKTATIESGEDIPYQEVSLSGGTAVAFKKAVLSLKVTPQVLPNQKVLLELQINQDKPSERMVQGVPAIDTRAITTSVLLRDGETIVLGGIYESDKEDAKQAIPFLGKIPILGLLFQQRDSVMRKRELLIFVTPKIIPQGVVKNDGEEIK